MHARLRGWRDYIRTRFLDLIGKEVMGRGAVLVVVLVVLVPTALGQLTGVAQGSTTLDALGVPHLASAWAVAMLIGSAATAASYAVPDPADSRVLEIAADALITVGAVVHLLAVTNEIGWSGSSWVAGMDTALVINCGGRALLLAAQIWWVARQARR